MDDFREWSELTPALYLNSSKRKSNYLFTQNQVTTSHHPSPQSVQIGTIQQISSQELRRILEAESDETEPIYTYLLIENRQKKELNELMR